MSAPHHVATIKTVTAADVAPVPITSLFRIHFETLAGAEGSTLITAENPNSARAAFKATHREGPTALIRKIKLDRSKEHA